MEYALRGRVTSLNWVSSNSLNPCSNGICSKRELLNKQTNVMTKS